MKIYIHSLTTNYIFVVVVPVQGSLVVAPEEALLPWVSSSPSSFIITITIFIVLDISFIIII